MEYSQSVRANVDSSDQASVALAAGAGGVGLCRTELMLLGPNRLEWMRAAIVAKEAQERERALGALLPLHQADLEDVFRVTSPQPVAIRLLDPPLQSFLPSLQQLDSDLSGARSDENWEECVSLDAFRSQHVLLKEANPSMGHRGCRLSLTHPSFLRMQVTAILRAAAAVNGEGGSVTAGIIIPLVASEEETRVVAEKIRHFAKRAVAHQTAAVNFRIGALIELPRAAVCAGSIAKHVDFVSFGTNDLTQMTFGFSREDMRNYFDAYLKQGIFDRDPFVSIDQDGVGRLIAMAIEAARLVKPDIEIGICGDHCSDPSSIQFFRTLGVSFVSCPPSCIPAARHLWGGEPPNRRRTQLRHQDKRSLSRVSTNLRGSIA